MIFGIKFKQYGCHYFTIDKCYFVFALNPCNFDFPPLITLPFQGCKRRLLEQHFLRPDAFPDVNHVRGMQYQIFLNISSSRYYCINLLLYLYIYSKVSLIAVNWCLQNIAISKNHTKRGCFSYGYKLYMPSIWREYFFLSTIHNPREVKLYHI